MFFFLNNHNSTSLKDNFLFFHYKKNSFIPYILCSREKTSNLLWKKRDKKIDRDAIVYQKCCTSEASGLRLWRSFL